MRKSASHRRLWNTVSGTSGPLARVDEGTALGRGTHNGLSTTTARPASIARCAMSDVRCPAGTDHDEIELAA